MSGGTNFWGESLFLVKGNLISLTRHNLIGVIKQSILILLIIFRRFLLELLIFKVAIILVVGFIGKLAEKFNLPSVSGYLILGYCSPSLD